MCQIAKKLIKRIDSSEEYQYYAEKMCFFLVYAWLVDDEVIKKYAYHIKITNVRSLKIEPLAFR